MVVCHSLFKHPKKKKQISTSPWFHSQVNQVCDSRVCVWRSHPDWMILFFWLISPSQLGLKISRSELIKTESLEPLASLICFVSQEICFARLCVICKRVDLPSACRWRPGSTDSSWRVDKDGRLHTAWPRTLAFTPAGGTKNTHGWNTGLGC